MSSTKHGQPTRKRPQKHQNAVAWKNDKFKTDPTTKLLTKIVITNCCPKCTGVIEWKVKYGKYKPLTQPGKCIKCHERRIKSAYHIYCTPCVEELNVCAKCGAKEAGVVNQPPPTQKEDALLQRDLTKLLKTLPERKRRTFLRYLEKQEEKVPKPTRRHIAIEEEQEKESDDDDEAENFTSLNAVRSAALEKLKVLSEKYGRKKDDDFDDFDIGELDLSDDDNEEGNEDENDH